jgi:hypothetical protein
MLKKSPGFVLPLEDLPALTFIALTAAV